MTQLRKAGLAGALGLVAFSSLAQPVVPPQAVEQFQQVIGNRIELLTILGGDHGAAGGIYTFRGGNLADLSVGKLGGGGIVASRKPLGVGGLEWAPVLEGNLGSASVENEFTSGYLVGNRSYYELLAVQGGGGVRVFFTENFSLTPAISGIYGHTENEFRPQNAIGEAVKAAASGSYVDWAVDTWSVVPALELKYEWRWKRVTAEFSSRYTYFYTESFESSSAEIYVEGASHVWENKLDVDAPLGWKLFGQELRTGGFFSRSELFGGAAAGLNEDHVYTANGRFVLDLLGRVWKVRWLGVGYSYVWGDHFGGWTAGVDLRLQF